MVGRIWPSTTKVPPSSSVGTNSSRSEKQKSASRPHDATSRCRWLSCGGVRRVRARATSVRLAIGPRIVRPAPRSTAGQRSGRTPGEVGQRLLVAAGTGPRPTPTCSGRKVPTVENTSDASGRPGAWSGAGLGGRSSGFQITSYAWPSSQHLGERHLLGEALGCPPHRHRRERPACPSPSGADHTTGRRRGGARPTCTGRVPAQGPVVACDRAVEVPGDRERLAVESGSSTSHPSRTTSRRASRRPRAP